MTLAVQDGGSNGQYLEASGNSEQNPAHFQAPSEWLGDWSDYQVLKFDLAITSRHYADSDVGPILTIENGDGQTATWRGPTPLWSWTHYEISLRANTFELSEGADLSSVLSDVVALRINAEFVTGAVETIGLDQVVLTSEPATVHSDDLKHTFTDGSIAGWRPVDDVTLTVSPTTGYPTFALRGDDWMDGRSFKIATPVDWSGDWSGFSEFRFDMQWTGAANEHNDVELIRIFGANGETLSWNGSFVNGVWKQQTVPFTAETFGVDQSSFENVMKHVSEMWIFGEFGGADDQLYLDNVTLATGPEAVPVFDTSLLARFGVDTEGWIAFDNAEIDWAEGEGLSGGAVKVTDKGTGNARLHTPDDWSGDWHAFSRLRFFVHIDEGEGFGDYPPRVEILGADGGSLSIELPKAHERWAPYTIDLTPETFGVEPAEFDAVMHNVGAMLLVSDLVNGLDATWFDDIALLANEAAPALPPERIESFDTEVRGWTIGSRPDATWDFVGAPPVFSAEAGNPPGAMTIDDAAGITFWLSPESWAGDWRGYESVSFDLAILEGSNLLDPGLLMSISSPYGNLDASISSAPEAGGVWNRYEFSISPEAFGVDADIFNRIMRDVSFIGIRSEWINGGEVEALDNFRISKAPEDYWDWIGQYLTPEQMVNAGISGKTADADQDGYDNWTEYLADTDPNNAEEFPWIQIHQGDSDEVVLLSFPTRAGRFYQIETTPDLVQPNWQSLISPTPGDGSEIEHVHQRSGTKEFFRLLISKPE